MSVYSALESSFTEALYIKRLNPTISAGVKATKDLNDFRWDPFIVSALLVIYAGLIIA